jgi:hypothetical protein
MRILSIALALALATPAAMAKEPSWLTTLCKPWRLDCCFCPDDYCAKLMPCPCKPLLRCDDYCAKQMPCPCKPCFTCDDYGPKPMPCPGPLCFPWYRCCPAIPTCAPE